MKTYKYYVADGEDCFPLFPFAEYAVVPNDSNHPVPASHNRDSWFDVFLIRGERTWEPTSITASLLKAKAVRRGLVEIPPEIAAHRCPNRGYDICVQP